MSKEQTRKSPNDWDGNTPIFTNSRSHDTNTNNTNKRNHDQIKSEQHHLTVEQIDVEDSGCERQWGWMDR
jgi:hypothetical protein